jgi:hypothetical protein
MGWLRLVLRSILASALFLFLTHTHIHASPPILSVHRQLVLTKADALRSEAARQEAVTQVRFDGQRLGWVQLD